MRPSPLHDRRVHADRANGQIVRYDRAGKWYVEWSDTASRTALTIQQAATIARAWRDHDNGTLHHGLPGGKRFDHLTQT